MPLLVNYCITKNEFYLKSNNYRNFNDFGGLNEILNKILRDQPHFQKILLALKRIIVILSELSFSIAILLGINTLGSYLFLTQRLIIGVETCHLDKCRTLMPLKFREHDRFKSCDLHISLIISSMHYK